MIPKRFLNTPYMNPNWFQMIPKLSLIDPQMPPTWSLNDSEIARVLTHAIPL